MAFWRGIGRMTLILFWVAAVLVILVAFGLALLAYVPSFTPTPDPPPTGIPGLPCCTLPPVASTGP